MDRNKQLKPTNPWQSIHESTQGILITEMNEYSDIK